MNFTIGRTVLAVCGVLAAGVTMALVACSSHAPLARVADAPGAESSSAPSRAPAATPLLGDIPLMPMAESEGAGLTDGRSYYAELQTRQRGASPARAAADRRVVADASCLPPLNEEVWVIERPDRDRAAEARGEEVPGCGALMTSLPDSATPVPVPLKHTDVSASIAGAIASVQVTQQFHNPFASKIEAVYVFPLPENAAVNEFLMTVGDRVIRGIIREREEAKQIYAEARAQGYTASLLTQERPNIFTQKVANIEPGKGIDITIRYFNTVAYSDGAFEFVFPMVVGPRFNPPHTTDGVYASPRGGSIPGGDRTSVEYLKPSERSGHDIGVRVAIDTGAAALEGVECRSHVVSVERVSGDEPGRAVVTLSRNDSIPNKDFVLRYRLAGEGVRSTAVAAAAGNAGYVSMLLVPPSEASRVARRPLELVFVLDCSGSMSGEPLTQAKRSVERALRRLGPEDTFQVIRFSNNAETLGPAPIVATRENVRRGLEYLGSLNSEGGTMMVEGVRAALNFPHDPSRLRFVCFLTDGYIGNEAEILGEIQSFLGPTRIFSFGIGSSVNRYLMDSMARLGRGAVSYVAAGDSASDIMDAFIERIAHAPMTDIRVELDGAANAEVFPSRVPDLFAGRPVMISARFNSAAAVRTVRVSGNVGGERVAYDVPVRAIGGDAAAAPAPALAAVWARHKIADLADAGASGGAAEVAGSIRQVALEFGLMSPYTAFVAVDSSVRTEGTHGTTVTVPVTMPEGVRYETTVPGGSAGVLKE